VAAKVKARAKAAARAESKFNNKIREGRKALPFLIP
jgi:hypothetical protein